MPATPAAARSVVRLLLAVADVVGDETLEGLELLEQLLRRDLLLRLPAPQHPRRRLHGGVPCHLVGIRAVPNRGRPAGRLGDPVQVDVLEAVALLLVEGDTRASPLVLSRLATDRRAERRVLATVV